MVAVLYLWMKKFPTIINDEEYSINKRKTSFCCCCWLVFWSFYHWWFVVEINRWWWLIKISNRIRIDWKIIIMELMHWKIIEKCQQHDFSFFDWLIINYYCRIDIGSGILDLCWYRKKYLESYQISSSASCQYKKDSKPKQTRKKNG